MLFESKLIISYPDGGLPDFHHHFPTIAGVYLKLDQNSLLPKYLPLMVHSHLIRP
jgi:hypothetical protein